MGVGVWMMGVGETLMAHEHALQQQHNEALCSPLEISVVHHIETEEGEKKGSVEWGAQVLWRRNTCAF